MRVSSYLEVNLGLLEENFNSLKKITKAKVLFMVKANAYGHGLVPITEHCLKKNLCQDFGCAALGEALILKEKLAKYKFTVYVFSETDLAEKGALEHYRSDLIPVIHQLDDLKTILKKPEVPIVLKFNTGMNRLGIKPDDVENILKLMKKNKRTKILHVMSHYSLSYLPLAKQKKTQAQYKVFQDILREIRDSGIEIEHTSIANSGAIEQSFSTEESYVRPGLMLYGPSALYPHYSKWPGKVISKMVTKILDIQKIKKGETVGYGDHVCSQDGLRVVVPVGYGDGILTSYTNASFTYKDFPVKFFGRVNMDLSQLFFPLKAEKKIKIGDAINLWEHDGASLQEMALQMKTIPYQLLCALNERIPRVYKS
ncbi:MAG: alanine racemase [Bacteriovoracaceae bacterium]|nr:alanine racemase [Bacteriovoracaceae bacterium]